LSNVATDTTAPGPPSRVRRWLSGFRTRETWTAYLFLLPWLFGFLVLTLGPMVASAYLSFTNYGVEQIAGFSPTESVGTEHYRTLIHDDKIRLALKNTFTFTVMMVPATMVVALALAMILARIGRAAGLFRTIFYIPQITPPVAAAVLLLVLFNGQVGLVNRALEIVGIQGPFWTTDPSWIKPSLVILSVWSVGGTMVIYLAALHGVPQQLYEAASIDGASKWRQFRNITLPMISPALFFTFIILTIAGLTEFTKAYTAFFGAGTKTNETEAALFYAVYLFRQSFEFFHFGYASSLAWLLFVVILVITFIQVRVSKRFVFYQGER
jgi:multiple sugar transport system permease protein